MHRVAIGGWAWVALAVTVALGIAADLIAHRADAAAESRRRALLWSAGWIGLAVLFGTGVALTWGARAGTEFASAYLVEKSLSVDNLCVFLLVFASLRVPVFDQRRVLFWGIAGALLTRGAFIGAGLAVILRWDFVLYGFGVLLVIIGARLFAAPPRREEPRIVRWVRSHLPFSDRPAPHRFFVRDGGHLRATPLLMALIAIELVDILFAMDSIPAAFAVTRTPFILYASNVLAVLGLRALFVVVADALDRLRYLRFGVAGVLVFSGSKMLAARWLHLPAAVSLLVIVVMLGASTLLSVLPGLGGSHEI